jgi:cytochrome P450 family 135
MSAAVHPATDEETYRAMLPPGPSIPSPVQTVFVWRWWDRYVRACQRRYGDVFTIRAFPFYEIVYVADPEHVRAIFKSPAKVMHAGAANRFMVPILGPHSVLTSDEDDHLRRRRLTSPMFHGEAVRTYAGVVAEIASDEVDRWRAGATIGMHERMRKLTFEVILRAVFGVTEPARLARMREVLPPVTDLSGVTMVQFAFEPLGRVWPWSSWVHARDRADAVLHEEIALRRADPRLAERRDVLSLLLGAGEMDDDEVRDHLMTLLLAGHETTATALAWAFERLVRTPDVLARATRAAHEDDHAYLDALVQEVLRVRPIIFDVVRLLAEPATIAGYDLPAGTAVAPAIGLVQRDARVYDDPYGLRPQRFLGEASPPPYTWIPFGGGVRRCLGAAFAQMEMRVVLGTVLRRAELRAADPAPERTLVRHVTLVPDKGARIVVDRVAARPPGTSSRCSPGDIPSEPVSAGTAPSSSASGR